MGNSWTVKIAGVSGTGKTTVMDSLRQMLDISCEVIIYSNLLKKFGSPEIADFHLGERLAQAAGLVLMDDHLEFDNPNKSRNYLRERTRGLVLLDVPMPDLVLRIVRDTARSRQIIPAEIARNLQISRDKAVSLSRDTKTPLLVIPNLEGEIERSLALIASFVHLNSP